MLVECRIKDFKNYVCTSDFEPSLWQDSHGFEIAK